MKLHLLLIFSSYLLVGGVGSHVALPSESYWKNKLPNTPMPNIIHDLLHPDQAGSSNPYTPKQRSTISEQLNLNKYSKNPPLSKSTIPNRSNLDSKNAIPNQGVNDIHGQNSKNAIPNRIYIYGQNSKNAIPNRIYIYGQNSKNAIPNRGVNGIYGQNSKNRQLQDSPGASLFFLESDLYPGAKMNLHFVVSTPSGTTFLPQKLARATPFSSNKLPEILHQFSVNPKSEGAEFIKQTITDCEQPAMENEEKYCATSLESLVEYGTSKFGKNVNVFTTEIVGDKGKRTRTGKQQYVVGSGVRKIVSDNLVACHSLPYPYAVFFCHATSARTAQAFVVPLVGADGTKIKTTAVCHKDTSKWDPDHVAFQVLKVTPGTVPVCHFLTEDTIVWAGKNKDN